jgi:hypothetical protein
MPRSLLSLLAQSHRLVVAARLAPKARPEL